MHSVAQHRSARPSVHMKHSRFSSKRFGFALVVHLAANDPDSYPRGHKSMRESPNPVLGRVTLHVSIFQTSVGGIHWILLEKLPVIMSSLSSHQVWSLLIPNRQHMHKTPQEPLNHHAEAPGLPTAPCHWDLLWQCPHSLSIKKGV